MLQYAISGRAWLEVDLDCLHHNIALLRTHLTPGCEAMAVVKANAYGQGAVQIARYLEENENVKWFGVACLSEATELRAAGIKGDILVLAYTRPELAPELIKNNITQAVASWEYALKLNTQAQKAGDNVKAHVKLDTGLTRTGFDCRTPEEVGLVAEVFRLPSLEVTGVFSHFASADDGSSGADEYCLQQISRYNTTLKQLEALGCQLGVRHMCNTGGIQKYPQAHFDLVRCGALLYGYNTGAHIEPWDVKLVTQLKAAVISLREIGPGTPVSYSRTFKAEKPLKVAVLSIGYADGYPRSLSRIGRVMLHGCWARQLGNVCMDQMMVDVTDIPGVKLGDTVTIIGQDGGLVQTADDIGAQYGSCMHEVMSRLGARLQRIYYQDGVITDVV